MPMLFGLYVLTKQVDPPIFDQTIFTTKRYIIKTVYNLISHTNSQLLITFLLSIASESTNRTFLIIVYGFVACLHVVRLCQVH